MHQDQNIAQTEQNWNQVSRCAVATGDLAKSLDLSSSPSAHLKMGVITATSRGCCGD